MASNLQVGERVYVPRSRLGIAHEASAFYEAEVLGTENRSIRISVPGGEIKTIGSALAHRRIGILIVRIGDYGTESTLLNPLAKSVLQYFRLLLSDDEVRSVSVRSLEELRFFWQQNHDAYSHMVVVGHGSSDGIEFGVDGLAKADLFGAPFEETGPVNLVSLCCETGYAAFSKPLSQQQAFNCVIAPFHSVHGAVASQFCQTFFSYHLLEGETLAVAFKHARESVPGGASFRMWRRGELKAGPSA